MGRLVAIYARVSTEHEEQLSALSNQVQYYDNIIKAHPDWKLYDRYIDEGITGTSIRKRKNFMKMIADAEEGKFDLIVTREVSRFARNTVDTLQETRKLKKIGVEVYFTEDNIWTFKDDDGELKLTIMATLAQNESKKISQRVKAGQKITFQNGVFYGTGNILGYDKVGKDMIVNEDQAKIVKLIFQLYLAGNGLLEIKYKLEKQGFLTSTGLKNWSPANISRILKNSFYCGTIVYRKSFIADYLEQKPKKNTGQVEQVVTEGRQVPLVSKEDFNKVQLLLNQHGSIIKNNINKNGRLPKFIWTKKLRCSCGSTMQHRKYHKRADGTITWCYQCYNQINTGTPKTRMNKGLSIEGICDTNLIPEWKLKLAAYFVFDKIWYEKNEILELTNKLIDDSITMDDRRNEIDSERKEYETKLTNLKQKSDKLLDAYLTELVSKEDYSSKKESLDKDISSIESKVNELESKSSISVETIQERGNNLKKTIRDNLNYKKGMLSDELIDTFVDRIVVHNDRLEWHLNFVNDIVKLNNERNNDNVKDNKKILLARMAITIDDVIEYSKYCHDFRTIRFNEPMIVEIYI